MKLIGSVVGKVISNLMNSFANPVKELQGVEGQDLTKGQRNTIEKNVQKEQKLQDK